LHGMGQAVYDPILSKSLPPAVRIYAPVGTHKDLLGYLVRRLLENGANNSFLKNLADTKKPIEEIIVDPIARIAKLNQKPHPRIPLPKNIYGSWQNSSGIDLSSAHTLNALKIELEKYDQQKRIAQSLIYQHKNNNQKSIAITSPSNTDHIIGEVYETEENEIEIAIQVANVAEKSWGSFHVSERAAILEKAADLFQEKTAEFITILTRESGKCIPDCISEIREAIDFCRYYAYRARIDFAPQRLPGPTGEENELTLHPRGTIVCISPWNFPLAIFIGQVVAALVTGNTVIAKPAEQTPLVAYQAIQVLHQAGVPKNALQLLLGAGHILGAKLVQDSRIAGVMFTGSTETAKSIEQTLANRTGPIALFIAETGGQNAMIVDSSALIEQTVTDIAYSAFNNAGQRCSALRVLFIQEDIASRVLNMLKDYIAELTIGDPSLLSTDIGPVIDSDALQLLQSHFEKMTKQAHLIAEVPMKANKSGHYFAPCVFQLSDLSLLQREVFGPILHVISYKATELDKVIESITNMGYGLTLGIHSRIETTIAKISHVMPIGNIYINRNMIGAVVGVQPFGGEKLSGTGPKAGGPHYLPRLCVERTISVNTTSVGGNTQLISLIEDDEA
jgi:RHH-type proline utilization regulon transcriptional repressor/proline dehydrogenase/delta 1-pyrroline-5-carboxylate dehydrogenase